MNVGRNALLGLAIGDAVGVPVEFKTREELRADPVSEMRAYGTHQQPLGTWSDDSSLTFCMAESLASNDYNLIDIAKKIIDWFNTAYWTAHENVFDIGGQTRSAIDELNAIFKHKNFKDLRNRSNDNEYSNGNGALMRILPLAFETIDLSPEDKFKKITEVTSLTHGHLRSVLANVIYLVFAELLIDDVPKEKAYLEMKKVVKDYFTRFNIPQPEQQKFARILDFNISNFEEEEIKSDGYVVHSLEASLWSFLKSENYETTILTSVNLGEDTDTTAAIAGGLAGIEYGLSGIPDKWKNALVKRNEIEALGDRLFYKYYE